jgi:hypothetical protein
MDALFEMLQGRTFWRILLFVHFAMAVGLLTLITLQAATIFVPVQQAAGNFTDRIRSARPTWYTAAVVILYPLTFLLGAWIYIKYRTYVRIPMEQIGHWKTLGSFEFKEHVVAMGMAMLPAYWYFWRQAPASEHTSARKWLTLFLAFTVWYSFLVGHVANDFRGVGS